MHSNKLNVGWWRIAAAARRVTGRQRIAGALALILVISMATSSAATARAPATGFLDRSIDVAGRTYLYQVFVPRDWTPRRSWPVILFLHGAGERGSDGLRQTEVGFGAAIRFGRERFPAIVVMPQVPEERAWTEPPMPQLALGALDAATREFNGDRRRTYLTGLSMGGTGVWSLAAENPKRFAALVPICGRVMSTGVGARSPAASSFQAMAERIGPAMPVWIFHGRDDDVVPVDESRQMYAALKALGSGVRYTEYEGVGHGAWDPAYAEPELMPWLLAQSLKSNP